MTCPKCGAKMQRGKLSCPLCGYVLEEQQNEIPQRVSSNVAVILLAISGAIALVTLLGCLIGYEKIYFFNRYTHVTLAWSAAMGLFAVGVGFWVKDLIVHGMGTLAKNEKGKLIATLVLVAVLPAIFLVSYLSAESADSNRYYPGSSYSSDPYGACHSVEVHKNALRYAFDLNRDGSISGYEMEQFLQAHPTATNNPQFMAWLRSLTD